MNFPCLNEELTAALAFTFDSVSYDIAKDGKVAAVLTLVKSKYRLGDTVTGVVTINAEGAIARIVRVSEDAWSLLCFCSFFLTPFFSLLF